MLAASAERCGQHTQCTNATLRGEELSSLHGLKRPEQRLDHDALLKGFFLGINLSVEEKEAPAC